MDRATAMNIIWPGMDEALVTEPLLGSVVEGFRTRCAMKGKEDQHQQLEKDCSEEQYSKHNPRTVRC